MSCETRLQGAQHYDRSCNCAFEHAFFHFIRAKLHALGLVGTVNWDDLHYILTVTESGSAVAAARKLGVDASTVQRRITRFEKDNGIHLFERRRRGLYPTPECRAIVAEAREIDERVNSISRDILGSDTRLEGLLRVTSTETFMTQSLAGHLREFCRQHPNIQLEITLTNAKLNLSRQDADVAIRPSLAPHETLIGQRVAGLGFALYGVKALLEGLSDAPDLEALQNLPWLGIGDALSAAPPAKWVTDHIPSQAISTIVDTFPAMVTCAKAGLGVALLPCSLADREPALLRRELPGDRLETSVWILTHPEIRNAARIKAFMAFMGKALRKERPVLEGLQHLQPVAQTQ